MTEIKEEMRRRRNAGRIGAMTAAYLGFIMMIDRTE